MAFVDTDEFFVIMDPSVATLPDLLQQYEGHGGLAVNWQVGPLTPLCPAPLHDCQFFKSFCTSIVMDKQLSNGCAVTRCTTKMMLHADDCRWAKLKWRAQMYGSSGHLARPGNSTLAAYTACYPTNHLENHHIKTIANLAFVEHAGGDPHHFTYKVRRSPSSCSGV